LRLTALNHLVGAEIAVELLNTGACANGNHTVLFGGCGRSYGSATV
jgi:hypothetical protein